MTRPIQFPLALDHRPSMAPEDFLVVPGNQEALGWIDRWPNWPAPALILYGPVGCGKSHLAQLWRRRSRAPLVRPDELSLAILPAILAQAHAVAVDGAESVAGVGDLEWALLHLYNLAAQNQGHLLLLAERPPPLWPVKLADLRSRLLAAPAVGVGQPDDEMLAAILVKLFSDRQLHPAPEVIHYLLPRMERSFAGARRLVEALDHASLSQRRRITVRLAREILQDLSEPAQLPPTPDAPRLEAPGVGDGGVEGGPER